MTKTKTQNQLIVEGLETFTIALDSLYQEGGIFSAEQVKKLGAIANSLSGIVADLDSTWLQATFKQVR